MKSMSWKLSKGSFYFIFTGFVFFMHYPHKDEIAIVKGEAMTWWPTYLVEVREIIHPSLGPPLRVGRWWPMMAYDGLFTACKLARLKWLNTL
jgi:hypothetical protein